MNKFPHHIGYLLLVAVVIVWLFGGMAYRWSCWPFAGIFGSVENLENVFAPVAAMFSALAAGATLYLLLWQFNEAKQRVREFTQQSFENKFFQLIALHRDTVRSIRYHTEIDNCKSISEGRDAFYSFYNIFHYTCGSISPTKFLTVSFDVPIPGGVSNFINQTVLALDGACTTERTVEIAESLLRTESNSQLDNYYHGVYVTLRYIHEHSPDESTCKFFMRIFRSQFSFYEYGLIYYHAAICLDDNSLAFKKLIEQTGFFHNMQKDTSIIDLTDNGKLFVKRYAGDAFTS